MAEIIGCTVRSPSGSFFSQAPRKVLLVYLGQKGRGTVIRPRAVDLEGGPTVLQEPHLSSTFGLAYTYILNLARRNHPNSLKDASKMPGQM